MLVELPRRVALWISLLAIGLASLLDASAASAGTLVEFPNLRGQTPEDLNGYLARPDTGLAAKLGSPSLYSQRHRRAISASVSRANS
jgi:hypothetical protein